MAQPTNPTTRTNPADILREALAGRSAIPLPQLIQQLRAAGMTAAELARTFGNLGIAPEMAAGILGASTGVLGKGEFIADYAASLDVRERAAFIEHTGYGRVGGGSAGGAAHAAEVGELGAALANAHTVEQKIEVVGQHFAHGGSIADAMEAMGVPREKAEEIRTAEEKANKEYDEKHAEEKEAFREKYRKQGLDEEQARKKAQEEYEAIRRQAVLDQMKRNGTLNGVPPAVVATMEGGACWAAARVDAGGLGVAATAKDAPVASRQIDAAQRHFQAGSATAAEITTLKGALAARRAAQGGDVAEVRAELDADAQAKAEMVRSVFDTGAKSADKLSAAALRATGVITEGEIGKAKSSNEDLAKHSPAADALDGPGVLGQLAKRRTAAELNVAAAVPRVPKVA